MPATKLEASILLHPTVKGASSSQRPMKRLLLRLSAMLVFSIATSGRSQVGPNVSPIPDQRTFPSLPTRAIPFIIGDGDTPADQLVLIGASADPSLIPATNIVFGGTGPNRTVQLIPVGLKGTNSITISVQDAQGRSTNEIFQLAIADFTDIATSLPQLDAASVEWGDYDNDGFLDLLVTGFVGIGGGPNIAKIYRNNGDGTFTLAVSSFQGIFGGGAVWGDYNNDGRLDVLLTGYYNGGYTAQRVYRNDGSNIFTQVRIFENPNGAGGIQPYRSSSLGWGDYDNDGKLDFIMMGWPFSIFEHNDGGDSFSDAPVGLPGTVRTSLAWGDYNNDGNLDFVLAWGYPTALYQNQSGGNFSISTNNFPGSEQPSIAWEDCNNDGDLDLVIVGSTNAIFMGDGHGNFTNVAQISGGNLASVAWGDFDNDGLSDLVVASYSGTRVLHNNGDGTFSDIGIALPAAGNGGVAVGDFNNDGRLDIAIAGGGVTKIFRNDGAMTDMPPAPPSSLNAVTATNLVRFSWSPTTQTGGLSYNLRVGTSPGAMDVLSAMADPTTGFRRIPALGNCGLNLSKSLTHLAPGTYYWSVQAINHAFVGSGFSAEQTFTLFAPQVISQPQNQTNVLGGTISLSVDAGGTMPFMFQWYENGIKLADNSNYFGSATSNLVISNVQSSNVGNYTVVIANLTGSITSQVAAVAVLNPLITAQPQSVVAWKSGSSSFSVSASGQQPLFYQWQLDGSSVDGATNSTLMLINIQASQYGNYTVVITNMYGSATSRIAGLNLSDVAVWGSSPAGETNLPLDLTNILAVSAGGVSYLSGDCQALRSDGTVIRWPKENSFKTNNLIAIIGGSPGWGLKADGTLLYWNHLYSPVGVSGASNIVALPWYSPGSPPFNLSLMANGVVVGNGSIPGISNIVAVARGNSHSLALKADGIVLAWGSNFYGQTNVPPGLSNVVAIAAGENHCLALKGDGAVVGWGENTAGQASPPSDLSNVVSIAAGLFHSLALRQDGTVIAWGSNFYGQTNVPPGLSNVVAIAGGRLHSLALVGNGPPVLQAMITPTINSNSLGFSFPTQSGRVYMVEYKDLLTDTNWSAFPLFAGNGKNLLFTDSTATNSQRYYRVLQW